MKIFLAGVLSSIVAAIIWWVLTFFPPFKSDPPPEFSNRSEHSVTSGIAVQGNKGPVIIGDDNKIIQAPERGEEVKAEPLRIIWKEVQQEMILSFLRSLLEEMNKRKGPQTSLRMLGRGYPVGVKVELKNLGNEPIFLRADNLYLQVNNQAHECETLPNLDLPMLEPQTLQPNQEIEAYAVCFLPEAQGKKVEQGEGTLLYRGPTTTVQSRNPLTENHG